jgi:hypothetical protein
MRVGKENDKAVESLQTATTLAMKNKNLSYKALEVVSLEVEVAQGTYKHSNPASFRKRP